MQGVFLTIETPYENTTNTFWASVRIFPLDVYLNQDGDFVPFSLDEEPPTIPVTIMVNEKSNIEHDGGERLRSMATDLFVACYPRWVANMLRYIRSRF